MAIEVKAKKWGNSIGIIIPNEMVERLHIKPEENIVVEIQRKDNVLKELFGAIKFTRPTDKILNDVRDDLEGRWL